MSTKERRGKLFKVHEHEYSAKSHYDSTETMFKANVMVRQIDERGH
jgi:hypothetical protein